MKKHLIALLKKHWLLLSMVATAIGLLSLFAFRSSFSGPLFTPIAWIEPKDTLTVEEKASRLDVYTKELEGAKNGKHFRKDEPIAPNFLQVLPGTKKANEAAPAAGKDSLPGKKQAVAVQKQKMRVRTAAKKQKSSPKAPEEAKASAETPATATGSDGFYTIKANDPALTAATASPAAFYRAVIHGDQKVRSNTTVRLRLLEPVTVSGSTIPRNTILQGRVGGGGNGRINVTISSMGSTPVTFAVLDNDYQKGIAYQMRETVQEAVREGQEGALEEVFNSLPYGGIAGGFARMGRNMARNFRSRQSYFLADGYPVFITIQK